MNVNVLLTLTSLFINAIFGAGPNYHSNANNLGPRVMSHGNTRAPLPPFTMPLQSSDNRNASIQSAGRDDHVGPVIANRDSAQVDMPGQGYHEQKPDNDGLAGVNTSVTAAIRNPGRNDNESTEPSRLQPRPRGFSRSSSVPAISARNQATTGNTDGVSALSTHSANPVNPHPVDPLTTSTNSALPANPTTSVPRVAGPGRSDFSVKHLTCFWWKTKGYCKWSEEDCLYAHRDTGRHTDAPRQLVPGAPALAGRRLERAVRHLGPVASTTSLVSLGERNRSAISIAPGPPNTNSIKLPNPNPNPNTTAVQHAGHSHGHNFDVAPFSANRTSFGSEFQQQQLSSSVRMSSPSFRHSSSPNPSSTTWNLGQPSHTTRTPINFHPQQAVNMPSVVMNDDGDFIRTIIGQTNREKAIYLSTIEDLQVEVTNLRAENAGLQTARDQLHNERDALHSVIEQLRTRITLLSTASPTTRVARTVSDSRNAGSTYTRVPIGPTHQSIRAHHQQLAHEQQYHSQHGAPAQTQAHAQGTINYADEHLLPAHVTNVTAPATTAAANPFGIIGNRRDSGTGLAARSSVVLSRGGRSHDYDYDYGYDRNRNRDHDHDYVYHHRRTSTSMDLDLPTTRAGSGTFAFASAPSAARHRTAATAPTPTLVIGPGANAGRFSPFSPTASSATTSRREIESHFLGGLLHEDDDDDEGAEAEAREAKERREY